MPNKSRITSWLYPPVLLGATVCGAFVVLQRPTGLLGWALGFSIGAVVLWILISALFPSTSKKQCPACGKLGMQRISGTARLGARCAQCRYEDAEQSAFLLAEEEDRVEAELRALHEVGSRPVEARSGAARRRAPGLRT
jgi:hypothetical protein